MIDLIFRLVDAVAFICSYQVATAAKATFNQIFEIARSYNTWFDPTFTHVLPFGKKNPV